MTSPPQLPSWATPKAVAGPPAPDSPLDRQFAAFVGPRWPVYRRKFATFFVEPRFQPTWNWAAALLSPFWFLYRKLYLPFLFFAMMPGLAFSLLWGDASPTRQLPDPRTPSGPPLTAITEDALLVMMGVVISSAILAGGTANFLLFRRARAAIRVIAPQAPDAEGALALLGRIGGTSWRAVGIGLVVVLLLQLVNRGASG